MSLNNEAIAQYCVDYRRINNVKKEQNARVQSSVGIQNDRQNLDEKILSEEDEKIINEKICIKKVKCHYILGAIFIILAILILAFVCNFMLSEIENLAHMEVLSTISFMLEYI